MTKRMKADVHELSKLIQSPKELKECVKRMIQKYISDEEEDSEGNGVESDIQVVSNSPPSLSFSSLLSLSHSSPYI